MPWMILINKFIPSVYAVYYYFMILVWCLTMYVLRYYLINKVKCIKLFYSIQAIMFSSSNWNYLYTELNQSEIVFYTDVGFIIDFNRNLFEILPHKDVNFLNFSSVIAMNMNGTNQPQECYAITYGKLI